MARLQTQLGGLVVLISVVILAAVLFLVLPMGIRAGAEDQKCRFRLLRMGQALNAWVGDHGHSGYPAILNPEPAAAWEPGRTGNAGSVLWEYLHGDVPPPRQRPEESDESYHDRLRDRQLTLCPVNDLPYWYNQDLRELDPERVADGALERVAYFHCQRDADGGWPHRREDATGVHVVDGIGVQYQLSDADLVELRESIARLEREDPEHPDLTGLRRDLAELEQAIAENGFAVSVRLDAEVRFAPRE